MNTCLPTTLQPHWLAAALLVGAASLAGAQTVTVNTHQATATGVQFGFWENHTAQDTPQSQGVTMARYGRRPTARVGIDAWSSIETQPPNNAGPVYKWGPFDQTTLAWLQATHQHGEDAMVAVNVSFNKNVSNKSTIPAWYADDITLQPTRQRGLDFITAYVQHVAAAVGSFTLTIDYEINDNYKLVTRANDPKTCVNWYDCRDSRAQTWADWYVEAVQAARKGMQQYNASRPAGAPAATLTIQPIMNSDVSDPNNAMNSGNNAWYREVVANSNQIAFDTYHCSAGQPVTDATHTLMNMMAWANLTWAIDPAKNLVVTENGFSSGLTQYGSNPPPAGPTLCAADNGKYLGTESEQATYFSNLFSQLRTAMSGSGTYGALRGRVKAFHIWSIIDNPMVATTDTDHYFGMLMGPGDPSLYADKAAAPVVYDGIVNQFEGSADLSPMSTSVGASLVAGTPLTFSNGVGHDFLAYKGPKFTQSATGCTATVTLSDAQAGDTVLLKVNSSNQWLSSPANSGSASFALDTNACNPTSQNMLLLEAYVTGSYFPMTRHVTSFVVKKSS
jgi:hypothetical protein